MNEGTQLRLDEAERLLTNDKLNVAWQRCVVWLIRLALEHEVECYWMRRSPAVCKSRRMRSKLLALGVALNPAIQYGVNELWSTLSRAAHHHHYELAPTAAELRRWLNEARTLCDHLARQA